MKKICDNCGKEYGNGWRFATKTSYCSSVCRKAATRRQKEQRICLNCEKNFLGWQKYCSPECCYEANKKQTLKRSHDKHLRASDVCVVCGGDLPTQHSSMKYCSSKCRNRARTINSRAKPVEISCRNCGDLFIGDNRLKYCEICRLQNKTLFEAVKVCVQRQRARLLGLPADYKPRDWRQAKAHFNNHCAYCGGSGELHQDHFVPLSLGGGTTKKNIVPACPSCNGAKSDTHPAVWLPAAKYQQISAYLLSA